MVLAHQCAQSPELAAFKRTSSVVYNLADSQEYIFSLRLSFVVATANARDRLARHSGLASICNNDVAGTRDSQQLNFYAWFKKDWLLVNYDRIVYATWCTVMCFSRFQIPIDSGHQWVCSDQIAPPRCESQR